MSMTCLLTRPPRCFRASRPFRASPRSPTAPTGSPTTISAPFSARSTRERSPSGLPRAGRRGPAPIQPPEGPRGSCGTPQRLPGQPPPAHRHRARARRPDAHHHQRARGQLESPDRALRTVDDHRAAPCRDHPCLLCRRALEHCQSERRSRRHARRARLGARRLFARPAAGLSPRGTRHDPAPVPRDARPDHHHRRHNHRAPRTPRLLTGAAPSEPPYRYGGPMVGRSGPALRIGLKVVPNSLCGNRR